MPVIVWKADSPDYVDALVRYVKMQKGSRVYLVLTENRELIVRPRVQSRMDSGLMRNVTDDVWKKIRDALLLEGPELFPSEGYSWAEDRQTLSGDPDPPA